MSKGSLKLRELLERLKAYGITIYDNDRGKGSETILFRPSAPGSSKGPQFTIKNHGMGTEITVPVINAALRRFSIDPNEFWKGKA
jgi:hypothetical protein